MRQNVKYYHPGEIITLFDYKVDLICQGVLLFPSQPVEEVAPQSSFFSTIFNTVKKQLLSQVSFIEGQLPILKKQLIERIADNWQILDQTAVEIGTKLGSFSLPAFSLPLALPSFRVKKLSYSFPDYGSPVSYLKSLATNFRITSGKLAILFILISFLSLMGIVAPIVAAQMGGIFNNGGFNKQTQSAVVTGFEHLKKIEHTYPTPEPLAKTSEFTVNLPKIGIESDISPNVDLADEDIYKQKLKENGVAHALGSYFPGEDGPVYLFAHSTDSVANIPLFNAKFYSLKEMEVGDEIDLSFHGKQFKYVIKDKQIINPEDMDIIRNSDAKLILQTCWPPGTD